MGSAATQGRKRRRRRSVDAVLSGDFDPAALSERDLQRAILHGYENAGWLVFHEFDSRFSNPGFPDVFAVHPQNGQSHFVELKSAKGQLRPAQEEWIQALKRAGHEVYILRPEELPAHLHWIVHHSQG
jgi:hypothetical protein